MENEGLNLNPETNEQISDKKMVKIMKGTKAELDEHKAFFAKPTKERFQCHVSENKVKVSRLREFGGSKNSKPVIKSSLDSVFAFKDKRWQMIQGTAEGKKYALEIGAIS